MRPCAIARFRMRLESGVQPRKMSRHPQVVDVEEGQNLAARLADAAIARRRLPTVRQTKVPY